MIYETELIAFSTGDAAEKLGVSRKTIFNHRERFGMWHRQEEGKYFKAKIADLAELLAMKKLNTRIGGEEAAKLAKYCARGISFFALRETEAWIGAERSHIKAASDALIGGILAELFPNNPRLGMFVEHSGATPVAARWLIIWSDGHADAAIDEALVETLTQDWNRPHADPVVLLDLEALGMELVRLVGPMVKLNQC